MKFRTGVAATALIAACAIPGSALAQEAFATTDLNMRAGPGPEYPVVDFIATNEPVTIHGCTGGGNWCDVTAGGARGWAYSEYLAYETAGNAVILPQAPAEYAVPTVTYQTETYWDDHYRDRPFYSERERYVTTLTGGSTGAAAGIAGGAATGALIGGPIGAVVGGVAGAALGASIDPPERVTTYVVEQEPDPVYLQGEVVLGATVPEPVTLYDVPEYQYRYAVINGQRVLIEPSTRQVVYVYR